MWLPIVWKLGKFAWDDVRYHRTLLAKIESGVA